MLLLVKNATAVREANSSHGCQGCLSRVWTDTVQDKRPYSQLSLLLAIWGKNDPFLIPPGAEVYRRDNPNAAVELLDTGHFAPETHVEGMAEAIHRLLARVTRSQ